jgi:hypothetical protein
MDTTTTATTIQERFKELLVDEEKYYWIVNDRLTNMKIPKLINFGDGVTIDDINREELKLIKLKHTLNDELINCFEHTAFLAKKVSALQHASTLDLPGVSATELSIFVSKLKDYLSLFNRLSTMYKSKIGMVNDNMRLVKTLGYKFRVKG